MITIHKKGFQDTQNLNIREFHRLLPNSDSKQQTIDFLENGYPIWLKQTPINLSQKISNSAKNKKQIIKILNQFITETKNGDIEPINYSPKYIINVFCVPKKDSETGKMTKLRVVRHGSYSTKYTKSINDFIDPEKCKMNKLPNLKTYVEMLFDKKFFSLRDLKDAFRQIKLCIKDADYMGYSIFGLKFRDRKQPYGIASAPANCQNFALAIIDILESKIPSSLLNSTLVHIDDFIMAAKTKTNAELMFKTFDEICNLLNIKISTDKNINCTQKAVVYGFEFDLKNKTVGIPDTKYKEMIDFIDAVIKYKKISGRALESLCGKIMHWSQLRKPAKALCYNMIGFIYQHIRDKYHHKLRWFTLPECIIQDLKFWRKYAALIKTVSMDSIIYKPKYSIYGSSDACDTGAGFVIGNKWGVYKFSQKHIKWHINQKEAHAVLMLIYNQRNYLSGKRLTLYVDNTSLFFAMCKHWSSATQLMPFIYEISLLMIKYCIEIWFEWIPSKTNVMADALSRYDFNHFYKYTKLLNLEINKKPMPLFYYSSFKLYLQ